MKTGLKLTKLAKDIVKVENTFDSFKQQFIRSVSITTNNYIWAKAYFGYHATAEEKRLIAYLHKVSVKVWNQAHPVQSTKQYYETKK